MYRTRRAFAQHFREIGRTGSGKLTLELEEGPTTKAFPLFFKF